jgi:hypothetical protein
VVGGGDLEVGFHLVQILVRYDALAMEAPLALEVIACAGLGGGEGLGFSSLLEQQGAGREQCFPEGAQPGARLVKQPGCPPLGVHHRNLARLIVSPRDLKAPPIETHE